MPQKDPFGKENLSDAEKKFLDSGKGFTIKMSFNLNSGKGSPSVVWDILGTASAPGAPKEEEDKLGKACLIVGDGLRRALGPGGSVQKPNDDFFKLQEEEATQSEQSRSRIRMPQENITPDESDETPVRAKKKTKRGQSQTNFDIQ